jgi:SAM-dependent methyltransferase
MAFKRIVWPVAIRVLLTRGDPAVWTRWRWLRKKLSRGRTLDAGCGGGDMAIYAAMKGNPALGISNEPECINAASKRAKALGVPARFEVVDLRSAKNLGVFDQIICFEVIEHILDDAGFMKRLAQHLVQNGRLILIAPYKHHKKMGDEQLSPTEDGGHVRFGYTHEELETLCSKAGLVVRERVFLSGVITQLLIRIMRLFRPKHPFAGWIAVLPLRPLLFIDAPLSRMLRYPFLSVGLLAVKK